MPTLGIELCDAALRVATYSNSEARLLDVTDRKLAEETVRIANVAAIEASSKAGVLTQRMMPPG